MCLGDNTVVPEKWMNCRFLCLCVYMIYIYIHCILHIGLKLYVDIHIYIYLVLGTWGFLFSVVTFINTL